MSENAGWTRVDYVAVVNRAHGARCFDSLTTRTHVHYVP